MRNPIRFKSWGSIINRAFVLSALGRIELHFNTTRPSPSLQMHSLESISIVPPFSLLALLVLLPRLLSIEPRREEPQECGEGEIVVSGEKNMLLSREFGRQGDQEVDDLARVRAAVAVVAEEDDGGGVE